MYNLEYSTGSFLHQDLLKMHKGEGFLVTYGPLRSNKNHPEIEIRKDPAIWFHRWEVYGEGIFLGKSEESNLPVFILDITTLIRRICLEPDILNDDPANLMKRYIHCTLIKKWERRIGSLPKFKQ